MSIGNEPFTLARTGLKSAVLAALALWFVAAAALGSMGALRAGPGEWPLALLAAVTLPIAAFLALYLGSRPFRAFVLGRDLRLVTMMQAWRVAGFAFLALYAQGLLPGVFAWPAGLGDIAIGATAPFVALALVKRPDFAAGKAFIVWNLLGILDFVVAVGTGILASGAVAGLAASGPTTAPMGVLPLVLIPGFAVPLFTILHLVALFQARRLARVAA